MDPSKLKGRFLEYAEIKDGETKECLEVTHDMNLIMDVMFKDPINVKSVKDKLNRDHKYYCSSIVDDFMNYVAESYAWVTTLETAKFYNETYSEPLDMDVLNLNLAEGKFDTSLCTFNESFLLIYKNHVNLADKVRFLVNAYSINIHELKSADITKYLYNCLLAVPEYNVRHLNKYHSDNKYQLPADYINRKFMIMRNLRNDLISSQYVEAFDNFEPEIREGTIHIDKDNFMNIMKPIYFIDYVMTRCGMYDHVIKAIRSVDSQSNPNIVRLIESLNSGVDNTYRYFMLIRDLPIQYKIEWLDDTSDFQYIHPYILLDRDMKDVMTYRLISQNPVTEYHVTKITKLCIEIIKSRMAVSCMRGYDVNELEHVVKNYPEVFDKDMFSFMKSNYMFNILDQLQELGITEPS